MPRRVPVNLRRRQRLLALANESPVVADVSAVVAPYEQSQSASIALVETLHELEAALGAGSVEAALSEPPAAPKTTSKDTKKKAKKSSGASKESSSKSGDTK